VPPQESVSSVGRDLFFWTFPTGFFFFPVFSGAGSFDLFFYFPETLFQSAICLCFSGLFLILFDHSRDRLRLVFLIFFFPHHPSFFSSSAPFVQVRWTNIIAPLTPLSCAYLALDYSRCPLLPHSQLLQAPLAFVDLGTPIILQPWFPSPRLDLPRVHSASHSAVFNVLAWVSLGACFLLTITSPHFLSLTSMSRSASSSLF